MTGPPHKTILLAAEPGPLRDALQALLFSISQVYEVSVAGDPAGIMRSIENRAPNLIILVIDLSWTNLPQVLRTAAPASRLVVLTDHEVNIDAADLVLQQGTHPELIVTALLTLLSDSVDNHKIH